MCGLRVQILVLLLIPFSLGATEGRSSVVRVSQYHYLGSAFTKEQTSNYYLLDADLSLTQDTRLFKFHINPVVEGALNHKDELYFGASEAYVEPKDLAPGFRLVVGRQKRTWSRLDEEFNLGVWQPQLRWDYLEPKQQGLTGVFFYWDVSSGLEFSFFTSPLFLPDQGPNYDLDNGSFRSGNRWFVPPQSQISMFSGSQYARNAPLYFEIDQPTTEKIVMNSSLGFGVMYQDDGPFWGGFNYAYKPRNQLHLGIECSGCAKLVGPPIEVTAVIHPTVVKHHVITVESGFETPRDRGWLSLTGDFPTDSDLPAEYEETPLNSQLITGVAYEREIPSWIGVGSWLKGAYLHTFDLSTKSNRGFMDSDEVQSSMDRYPYRELAVVEWRLRFWESERSRLEWKNRYHYSIPERGGWVSSHLDCLKNGVLYFVGVDLLGSDVAASSKAAGLFTRYRANDRVFGGIGYVF